MSPTTRRACVACLSSNDCIRRGSTGQRWSSSTSIPGTATPAKLPCFRVPEMSRSTSGDPPRPHRDQDIVSAWPAVWITISRIRSDCSCLTRLVSWNSYGEWGAGRRGQAPVLYALDMYVCPQTLLAPSQLLQYRPACACADAYATAYADASIQTPMLEVGTIYDLPRGN